MRAQHPGTSPCSVRRTVLLPCTTLSQLKRCSLWEREDSEGLLAGGVLQRGANDYGTQQQASHPGNWCPVHARAGGMRHEQHAWDISGEDSYTLPTTARDAHAR